METLFRQLDRLVALTPEAKAAFGRLFTPQLLAKHEFFVRAGDSTHSVAFVISGIFRCFATSPDGVEYNKTFFIENDLMGIYYALLLNRPSPLSVQALTPCSVLTADFRQIEALYDEHPTIERLARKQAEHLFLIKEQREIDLVMLDAKARYEKFKCNFPAIEQAIPQYHIASHLGITPTQLSRIRADR
ncbi:MULTISPECIES: Crp/Fnr family transcriptional regulator [unclassified Spirosoma]|uniref:Crp/Fnr family transcriptional regulator n=1 Tax=unclassified Spirosoma TaxID=2621999 RepID=UPI0009640626|nr:MULTISPECIES: Crp/Fnr family transcriptional regulator [unclassified Spirosoma]MBN8823252.1 Crp/Fnr family transcriptional regulator [Spirosoma sp.]OJW72600.1 MAG: cyclic nucleotide-binding protein [Spirosoma sp. 48-14]